MRNQPQIESCINNIHRIATTLVPDKEWYMLHIEGCIVGSITEIKSWFTLLGSENKTSFDSFDLAYVNDDVDNNQIGGFVEKLREATYEPTMGAWYTVSVDFYKFGSPPVVHYNYYDMPAFSQSIPVKFFQKDLKVYPRSAALPDWMT